MKSPAKVLPVLILGMLMAVFSVAAHASSNNDPKIVIRDAGCNSSACTITNNNFSFTLPANPNSTTFSGVLGFGNGTQHEIDSLVLLVPASVTNVTCGSQLANWACAAPGPITVNGKKYTEVTFYIPNCPQGHCGFAVGSAFDLGFSGQGSDQWPAGTVINGYINHNGNKFPMPGSTVIPSISPIPEPGTMALLATGIGAVVSRRKRWKKAAA